MSNDPSNFLALLVGISQYAKRTAIASLGSCVNDIRAVGHLVRERFGVPAEHVRTLVDAQATRRQSRMPFART